MKIKTLVSILAAGLSISCANSYAFTPLKAPFTTSNGQIIDGAGQAVSFQGVNWFGFNTGNHILHGLWSADFARMLRQMKSLGFNAVRIPFQFDFVLDPSIKPSGINTSCDGKPDSCNLDIPADSALHALQWVVGQFTSNGMYVLLDDHYEDDTYRNDPAAWLRGWETIARLFRDNPLVGYDIYNEPDSHQITWDGENSTAPAWSTSLQAAADAIYAIDANKLIFVEGTAQGKLESNWGDGFATDDDTVRNGVSNPKNFFSALMHKPYLKQVVISPHVYGPDGTNGDGTDESDPQHAFKTWSRLFGYLNQGGFCVNNADCHVFPVAVGEFGGKFDEKDPWYKQDVATNLNLSDYLNQLSSQGSKSGVNWFYWDWNPNSGNTGGILKDDWKTVDCNKVNFLVQKLALKPQAGICEN